MIKVCIIGLGRTGKEVAKVLLEAKDIKIVSAICSPESDKINMDLGEVIGVDYLGINIVSSDEIKRVCEETLPDVAVDFSNSEAALKNASILSKMRTNIVIGTTGFNKSDIENLYKLTQKNNNAIVYAPNITLGVNVLLLLTNLASTILNDYDFHISEVHHKNKKDSPSGTAFKIATEVEKGVISSGKEKPEVTIDAVRVGGVVGSHKVMLVGEYDKLEITHESFSRKAFALGALKAIRFINKKAGYYEMGDVLELGSVLNQYMEEREVI